MRAVVALSVAGDGSVWAGTAGRGVAHLDGARWEPTSVLAPRNADRVLAVAAADAGAVWAGTPEGLWQVGADGGPLQVEGVPAERPVLALALAGDVVWAATPEGLHRLPVNG